MIHSTVWLSLSGRAKSSDLTRRLFIMCSRLLKSLKHGLWVFRLLICSDCLPILFYQSMKEMKTLASPGPFGVPARMMNMNALYELAAAILVDPANSFGYDLQRLRQDAVALLTDQINIEKVSDNLSTVIAPLTTINQSLATVYRRWSSRVRQRSVCTRILLLLRLKRLSFRSMRSSNFANSTGGTIWAC